MEECQKAVAKLEAPDKWSRNKANDGRRIEPCTGGWKILNGDYYRRLLSDDERREYHRNYQRGYRLKKSKPLPGEMAYVKAVEQGYE